MSEFSTGLLFGQPVPVQLQEMDALFDTFDEETAAAVQQALATALATGMNPTTVAPFLVDAMSPSRAETIARTEMLGAYRDFAGSMYRANSDVVQKWMWSAAGSNSCAACIFMDGTTFDLDEGMNSHPNCRCAQLPVTVPWSDILGPLGIDFTDVPGSDITVGYEDGISWFLKQSDAVQRDMLGPAKFEAWQQGDLHPLDLIGRDPDTGAVYERSLKEIGLDFRDYLDRTMIKFPEEYDIEFPAAERGVATDAEQALAGAQARLEQVVRSGASREDIRAAQWDVANRQAAVDLANGGRGYKIVMSSTDPLDTAPLEQSIRDLFGRDLTRDEIGQLVGAPEGSSIVVFGSPNNLVLDVHGPGYDPMHPLGKDAEFYATRYFTRDTSGNLFVRNANFEVREDLRGQGMGARIFAEQVQALADTDVRYIEAQAAGSAAKPNGPNGFYTWPRFGFVGPLSPEALGILQQAIMDGEAPEAWGSFTTIQELMQAPGGADWWKANGVSLKLRFDMTEGSYSRRTLEAYLEEMGDG